MAQRLERLRSAAVPWLCIPPYVAAAFWMAIKVASGGGGAGLLASARDIGTIAALVSPLCVAMAIVLTAVSSMHEPFARVRVAWILILAAAGCTVVALVSLVHHVPA